MPNDRTPGTVTFRVTGANGKRLPELYTITEGADLTIRQPFEAHGTNGSTFEVNGVVYVKVEVVEVRPGRRRPGRLRRRWCV